MPVLEEKEGRKDLLVCHRILIVADLEFCQSSSQQVVFHEVLRPLTAGEGKRSLACNLCRMPRRWVGSMMSVVET